MQKKPARMVKAIIMHSVEDAEHCVRNGIHEGNRLFSTHSSVDVFLKEKYSVECKCLSKFLNAEYVSSLKEECSEKVDRLTATLDRGLTPELKEHFGSGMRLFHSLYSYFGRYQLLAYYSFLRSVDNAWNSSEYDGIELYDYKFDHFFDADISMEDLVSGSLQGPNINILRSPSGEEGKTGSRPDFSGLFEGFKKAVKKALLARRFSRTAAGKKNVILFEGLYQLSFLRKELKDHNILYFSADSDSPAGFSFSAKKADIDLSFIEPGLAGDGCEQALLRSIKQDAAKNMSGYLNSIENLRKIEEKHPVSLGIWGAPPIKRNKAVVFEYLRSRKTRVIGAQHGGAYGINREPWHFNSDFDRCDDFISYGFKEEDLERLYPGRSPSCRILPLGMIDHPGPGAAAERIDILFPMVNSLSMLEEGMSRIPPDVLTERQIALLRYLDSKKGFNIIVKPFPFPDHRNCSVLPVLEKLKNVKVVYDLSLSQILKSVSPKAVLMEYPSTPLYEVMHMDSEIFLMGDPALPFEEQAVSELKKRVHYSDDVGGLIRQMDLFLEKKLEQKRDGTFFAHYIYKEHAKENVLAFVSGTASGDGERING